MREPELTARDMENHEKDLRENCEANTTLSASWIREKPEMLARFARTFCVCTRKSAEE
jgi:hypothetical protein